MRYKSEKWKIEAREKSENKNEIQKWEVKDRSKREKWE